MSKKQPSLKVRYTVATWPDDAPRGAVTRFCQKHRVSRSWFYHVKAEADRAGPIKALEKKPPVALTQPLATPEFMIEVLLGTRQELQSEGYDYGPLSVIAKLRRRGFEPPSRATVARIFSRTGAVIPEPKKKPHSALKRFRYPQPNACWQIDATEWVLADGTKVVIFQLLDDHSRFALASLAASGETSEAAIRVVQTAIERHGVPVRFLSDNGTALNPTRRGRRGALVEVLKAHGVTPITGKPGKPTTQGKNERFHQTLHRYLRQQPVAASVAELQTQVDVFDAYYNTEREHQALDGLTPQEAWEATPKAPEPALPESAGSVQRQTVTKQVGPAGNVKVLGTWFKIGAERIGSMVIVIYDDVEIMFFDPQGSEIISHPVPAKGVRYVGNGKLGGVAADPAAAVRKRKIRPVKDTLV